VSAPVITALIDEATVREIADQAWAALVGEDEVLVPVPAELPADILSSWVDVVGPWTGSVVLTCGRDTAEELTRALLRGHAPQQLEADDVADALGELANVVGGNVKAVLPGPSVLGLPEVGAAPSAASPADTCRVDAVWRGQPLTISVQGAVLDTVADPIPENGVPL
jgi:chemotaxis protein CheX